MSTITKLEVNLSERYIPPVEPEEGSKEWCEDHLEDPRCEQYLPIDPVGPDEPVDPTPTPTPTPDTPETANTGHLTVTQTDNFDAPISQNQLSAILLGGFCILLLLAFAIPKLYNKFNKNRKNFYNLKKVPDFNKFRIASLSLAVLSLGASVFTSVKAYIRPQDVEVTASEKVTINADILNTNEIAYVHDTIRVPATELGFSLYATAGTTDLIDIHNPVHTIKSITEPGQLTDNTYGIYIGREAPTASTVFSPIYASTEQYSIYSTESAAEQAIDIWYAVRSKDNVASTYSVDIELRAIGKHDYSMQEMTEDICAELEPGIMDYEFKDIRDGKVYTVGKYTDGNCWMSQNLDLDLSTEATFTSADTDLPEGTTWTPDKATNVEADDEDWIYGEECIGGDFAKCEAYSYDSGITEDGNYFNAFSATAGTAEIEDYTITVETGEGEYSETIQRLSSTGSICPANWHLATENEWMNMMQKYIPLDLMWKEGGTDYLRYIEGGADMNIYDINLNIPSLNNAGIYMGDQSIAQAFIGENSRGVYKVYEQEEGDKDKDGIEEYRYRINTFAKGMLGMETYNKTRGSYMYEYAFNTAFFPIYEIASLGVGSSVRCVSNYNNFSLSFDENVSAEGVTVENLPSSYYIAITDENKEKGVEFTLPSTAPTRSDNAEFLGWATSKSDAKNGVITYGTGDTFMITGAAMKLYPVWDDGTLIPHPYALVSDDGGLTFTYSSSPYKIGNKLDRNNPDSPLVTKIFDMPAENDMCNKSIVDGEISEEYQIVCTPAWSPMFFEDSDSESYRYINIDEDFYNYKPTNTVFWFTGMTRLESFTGIEYLNTSEVVSMLGMFMGYSYEETDPHKCPAILDLSTFDTRKVRDMTMMFMGSVFACIDGFENFKTNSLESATGMFLLSIPAEPTELDLSGWDMSNVKSIAGMFSLAISNGEAGYIIKGIENWYMPSVLSIENAFFGAAIENDHSRKTSSGEEILDLSNWNISNTTQLNEAFRSTSIYNGDSIYSSCEDPDRTATCENNTVVYDLSGWKTSNVTDMSGMFKNNESASKIIFGDKNTHGATGGWDVSNVTNINEVFRGARNLETIYAEKDWSGLPSSSNTFAKSSSVGSNLVIVGGNGTRWSSYNVSSSYARIDTAVYNDSGTLVSGTPGYFTNICVLNGTCPVAENQSQPAPQPQQSQSSGHVYMPSNAYIPTSQQSTEESVAEPEEKPVSTTKDKKSTKKSDTKSEQTEPLGVKKSVEETSTVDTATIAVIVASFVLVSAGAVIIFLIEKRRNEDEE